MKPVQERQRHTVDATDIPMGRLATHIALLLRGKQKSVWLRNVECKDEVEVVNITKMKITGNKIRDKFYYRHSGRPGGLKKISLEMRLGKGETGWEDVLRDAVKGMLPDNRLKKNALKRLLVRKS